MRRMHHWFFLCLILILLSACGESLQNQLSAPVEESEPIPTSIPPTQPVVEPATAQPEPEAPTAVPATSQPEPTATQAVTEAEPDPTMSPTAVSLVWSMEPLAQPLKMGQAAVVRGTSPRPGATVEVVLQAGPHRLIELETAVDAQGNWQAELTPPPNVQGAAQILATDGRANDLLETAIVPGENDPLGIGLMAVQPEMDHTAVAGAPLYFSGKVTNPINNTITFGFLANCNDLVAVQSITVSGDDEIFWNGNVILPREIDAEMGCATIATGDPASSTWREILIPMPLIPLEDEAALGLIQLANSPAKEFKAGTAVTLFGSALNMPAPELKIEWQTLEVDTTPLMRTVPIDSFGYWQANFQLPAEFFGATRLTFVSENEESAIITEIDLLVVE